VSSSLTTARLACGSLVRFVFALFLAVRFSQPPTAYNTRNEAGIATYNASARPPSEPANLMMFLLASRRLPPPAAAAKTVDGVSRTSRVTLRYDRLEHLRPDGPNRAVYCRPFRIGVNYEYSKAGSSAENPPLSQFVPARLALPPNPPDPVHYSCQALKSGAE